MRREGQLEPILVRKEKKKDKRSLKTSTALVLVDGAHRREAALSLGWTEIWAVLFDGDENAARVRELNQNLARAGLRVLDRAKSITELAQRTLGKTKAAELARPGGRQSKDKGISATAREFGYTRDDIRRSMVIATMSPDAMAKAQELGLDDNERALLRIAKPKQPDKQVALAEKLGSKKKRKKQTKPDKKDEATYAALLAAWKKAPRCEAAFLDAAEYAQRKFLRMLQSLMKKDENEDEDEDENEDENEDEAEDEDEDEDDDEDDEDEDDEDEDDDDEDEDEDDEDEDEDE
jgi:ParB-like chromosome segregation protein Spo0J